MLSEILQELIDEMFYNLSKPEVREYKNNHSKTAFINEFCTIKLCTHRRAGHTTAAWSPDLRRKYNILHVVKNVNIYKDYITTGSNVMQFADNSIFYNKFEQTIISKNINVIIFDTTFYLSNSVLRQIVNNLPNSIRDVILVLLQ